MGVRLSPGRSLSAACASHRSRVRAGRRSGGGGGREPDARVGETNLFVVDAFEERQLLRIEARPHGAQLVDVFAPAEPTAPTAPSQLSTVVTAFPSVDVADASSVTFPVPSTLKL